MKRTASRSNKELRLVFVRVCLIVAILPMVVPMPVQTADGDLDLTFGDGGTLLLPDISGIDAVAVQPDGKIIGVTIFVRPDITADFVLVRLESDGTLDSNFGSGGQVITDIFGGHGSPTDLVLQDDGKIVVLGTTEYRTPGPTSDFTIARYNSDGSLDASFGTGGIIHTGFSGNINFASSVLINPDGKILVVGTTGNSTNAPTFDFALARYNHDGSLDITFGNGGKLTLDFYNSYEVATSAAIQLDGKIVIAGSINNPEPSIALARFSKDGDLDISFGDAGKVTIDIYDGRYSVAFGVSIQSDGKIVVAGSTDTPPISRRDFALVRFTHQGIVDDQFGAGGKVTTDFFGGSDEAYDVALQSDGKIVVGGFIHHPQTATFDFALARYNTDGNLDASFGDGGKLNTIVEVSQNLYSLAIQTDGKILAAGEASGKCLFARYQNAPLMPKDVIQQLLNRVNLLATYGIVSQKEADFLTHALFKAMEHLDRERPKLAAQMLAVFIHRVTASMNAGKLPAAQGQPLIEAANAVISQIAP